MELDTTTLDCDYFVLALGRLKRQGVFEVHLFTIELVGGKGKALDDDTVSAGSYVEETSTFPLKVTAKRRDAAKVENESSKKQKAARE